MPNNATKSGSRDVLYRPLTHSCISLISLLLPKIQEQALAKDEARIKARRERDMERRDRFLNARTRIMGIDAQALDEQVSSMRRSRDEAKETDRIDSKCDDSA